MAAMWLASFLEKDKVFPTKREPALAEGTVEPLNMVGLAAVFVDMMECVRVVAS